MVEKIEENNELSAKEMVYLVGAFILLAAVTVIAGNTTAFKTAFAF